MTVQIARQLGPILSFGWIIRVMGFIILLNSIIIIVLARPRISVRPPGPLVEWSAFLELPYSLFAAGIFFTLWGVYIAYFYVCKIPSPAPLYRKIQR